MSSPTTLTIFFAISLDSPDVGCACLEVFELIRSSGEVEHFVPRCHRSIAPVDQPRDVALVGIPEESCRCLEDIFDTEVAWSDSFRDSSSAECYDFREAAHLLVFADATETDLVACLRNEIVESSSLFRNVEDSPILF